MTVFVRLQYNIWMLNDGICKIAIPGRTLNNGICKIAMPGWTLNDGVCTIAIQYLDA